MLRNISISLRATGPAAVLIVWMLCFTAVTLFGSGGLAGYAQGFLGGFGIFLLTVLAQTVE
jgi:hypothetical protein